MSTKYTIGLYYGTNSVRAIVVNVANGAEIAAAVWNYAHGTQGVILARDPNLARQHPADYVAGAKIESGKATMNEIEAYILKKGEVSPNVSGRQEFLENLINEFI